MSQPAVAPASYCAQHPTVAAVSTCPRCGSFACEACLPLAHAECSACRSRALVQLPSLKGRSKLAITSLFAVAGLDCVQAMASWILGSDENDPVAMMTTGLAALLYFVAFIVTIVLFLRWFHLAVRWSELSDTTPAREVWCWFIPFVNLVRPFKTTRSMLSRVGADEGPVGVWQALWIGGNVVGNISARTEFAGVGIFSALLHLAAAFACVAVIRSLTSGVEQGASTY